MDDIEEQLQNSRDFRRYNRELTKFANAKALKYEMKKSKDDRDSGLISELMSSQFEIMSEDYKDAWKEVLTAKDFYILQSAIIITVAIVTFFVTSHFMR